MWNKIFPAILAAALAAAGVLIYLAHSWLQSKTAPKDVAANFLYYSNLSWMFALVASVILLIAANVVLWKTRRSWALWASLLFFAVLTIVHKFWLDRQFFDFQQTNNLTDSQFSFSALTGAILIALAAVIVFFDQYLVKRLLDKTPPPLQPVEALPEESSTNEKIV